MTVTTQQTISPTLRKTVCWDIETQNVLWTKYEELYSPEPLVGTWRYTYDPQGQRFEMEKISD